MHTHRHTPSRRSDVVRVALAAGLFLSSLAIIHGQDAPRGSSAAQTAPTSAATDDSTSLRDYLARKRAAIARAGTPSPEATPLRAHVVAESRSGVRRLRIRDFQVLSDSERTLAGYNLGAGSWDTEVGVLASAVADEFLIQAAASGIPLDELDVVFTSRPDAAAPEPGKSRVAYPRNLQYTAYIVSPATDAQLDELRRTVDAVSPVLNLVSQQQDIAHGEVVYTQSPATVDPAQPPGLRDFLVEKRAALLARAAAAKAGAPAPSLLRAHVKVEGNTGLRHIRTGDDRFQIIHDSPRSLAGYDLGPTVEEHQLGVMGTCLTHIFEIQAAQRQVILDKLELRLEATLTPRTGAGSGNPPRYRNIRYTVHITSPAPAEEIDALRKAVEAVCPIYNLLKDAQPIEGRIVREAYREDRNRGTR